MNDFPIKVLCVAATGQSGSTIFTRLMGEVPGFFAAGEVGRVWDKGVVEDITCSCGERFSSCEFWTKVGETAFGGWDRVDAGSVARLRETLSFGHLPRVQHPFALPLVQWPRLSARYRRRLRRYVEHMRPIYAAIHELSGGRVIVDSMKIPVHVYMMALQMPDLDVRMVHHVRDSRGYAYSQVKFVQRQGDPERGRFRVRRPPSKSALKWDWVNQSFDHLAGSVPSVRIRYEDLMHDPAPELRRVAGLLDRTLSDDDLSFVHDGVAELGSGHIASGSRGRLRSGRVVLREDLEWVDALSSRDRRTVTTLTAPLLRRYGYRIAGPVHGAR